jgi:gamma-glutamylcyclotransferase (GGCT)/AIG2-like uncharacterized protein YtfP
MRWGRQPTEAEIQSKKSEDLDELIRLTQDVDANYIVTFVYGTLRPGEGNYWIEPDVVKFWEPAYTKGRMYASGIPFVDFVGYQKGDRVTGTVLVMKQGDLAADMIRMELGAGYEAMTVPVEVTVDDASVTVECLVWQYAIGERSRFASHVPSGDFRHTTGSRYAREILNSHPVR